MSYYQVYYRTRCVAVEDTRTVLIIVMKTQECWPRAVFLICVFCTNFSITDAESLRLLLISAQLCSATRVPVYRQILTDEIGVETADLGDGAFGSVVAHHGRTCQNWGGG